MVDVACAMGAVRWLIWEKPIAVFPCRGVVATLNSLLLPLTDGRVPGIDDTLIICTPRPEIKQKICVFATPPGRTAKSTLPRIQMLTAIRACQLVFRERKKPTYPIQGSSSSVVDSK